MSRPVRATTVTTAATLLRRWRAHRRVSQLALALEAGISSRHLSFLESGRAQASRDMLLRLARVLNLPPRECNALLLAGGFAPEFSETPLQGPPLAVLRRAVSLVLQRMEPYPALAVDRHWTLLEHNPAVGRLLAGVDAALLRPPVNVLRLSLHPRGLAPQIDNLADWRAHLLQRLAREVDVTADPALADLLEELRARSPNLAPPAESPAESIVIPLRLRTPAGTLSLLSTTTVFGTAADVTATEIAIESFLPADDATTRLLQALAASPRRG